LNIAIIDGQGGGAGRALIAELAPKLSDCHKIIALGTNAIATSAMMKAGASAGATGENAIIFNAPRVDIIAGPIGIIVADSMLGELTPAMAEAVARSAALKVLIPFDKCPVYIAGSRPQPLQGLIAEAVAHILGCIEQGQN
jgi:hypothetical protein